MTAASAVCEFNLEKARVRGWGVAFVVCVCVCVCVKLMGCTFAL